LAPPPSTNNGKPRFKVDQLQTRCGARAAAVNKQTAKNPFHYFCFATRRDSNTSVVIDL
jgi:hypothetical protein